MFMWPKADHPKSEGRNPKVERDPKPEIRENGLTASIFRISGFGLLSGFGVRSSALDSLANSL